MQSEASWDVLSTATGSPSSLLPTSTGAPASHTWAPPSHTYLKDKPVRGLGGLAGGPQFTLSPVAALMCLLALLGAPVATPHRRSPFPVDPSGIDGRSGLAWSLMEGRSFSLFEGNFANDFVLGGGADEQGVCMRSAVSALLGG